MVGYYAALAGGAPQRDERPVLRIDSQIVHDAAIEAGLEVSAYWAFAPGAEYGPAKRWPTAHYASLARALHARHGWPIALIGSAKEAPLCDEIAALAPGTCQVLAGRTTLDSAMALIAGARALVSNDSGLMHVAAALGLPQVALFGSTSPEHTPPLNPRASVLWLKDELKLDCMPCFERECRFGHYRCLQDLPPQRVDAALQALFERA
jgi:heptosyltransferase II